MYLGIYSTHSKNHPITSVRASILTNNKGNYRIKTGQRRDQNSQDRYISTSANISKMRKTQRMSGTGTMTLKRSRPNNGKLAPISVGKSIFDDQSAIDQRERSLTQNRSSNKRPKKYGRLKPMNL